MAAPALIYLEAEDEVTAIVRRMRDADGPRVVLVAPGRSRATSSVVALRLLARAAADDSRTVAVVGDALTRSLAAEAGIPAFATVDEARTAKSPRAGSSTTRAPRAALAARAAIHVVRGRESTETAPTLAAAPVAAELGSTGDARAGEDVASAETRSLPAAVPSRAGSGPSAAAVRGRASHPGARHVARRTRWAFAAILGLVLLGAGTVAAAVALPAARIEVVPRTVAIGPASYTLELPPDHALAGTVEAAATVVATGTYPILTPATGVVVFRNWSGEAVDAPAGTLVAAGDQAFETVAGVVVPAGSLTPEGRIAAGEVAVEIVAAAPGPAANVPAMAIDTVLSQGTASRLRAFENNPERIVLNPEPTTGGAETTGSEFTQADVDAGVEELRGALEDALVERMSEAGVPVAAEDEAIVVERSPGVETIAGTDGLVGQRDVAEAEISGSLAYDVLVVGRSAVEEAAAARVADDEQLLADGQRIVGEPEVVVGEASADGGVVVVEVQVTADALQPLDPSEVLERSRGRSAQQVESELAALADDVRVDLWPGWVTTVPDVAWRVDVVVAEP